METPAPGKAKRRRQTLTSRASDSANTDDAALRKPDYHPVLFRLFAELGDDEQKIFGFADRYGNLSDQSPLPLQQSQEPLPAGEQIAEELDSNVSTVKRWITGNKDEK